VTKGGLAGYVLPTTAPADLLVAEDLDSTYDDGTQRIVARSYSGFSWEAVPSVDAAPVNITCLANGTCSIATPGRYRTRTLPVPTQLSSPTAEQSASRLLLQGTFGASKTEILRVASRYSTDFGSWVKDQMRLVPSLVRTYYRQRSNPRLLPGHLWDSAPETQPCELNTRWSRHAFDQLDAGSIVTVRTDESASRFTLRIGGSLRAELTSFLGQPYPGSSIPNITFPATVRLCSVFDGLGGGLRFSPDTSTVCNLSGQTNPAIELSVDTSGVQSIASGAATLVPVAAVRPGSFVLLRRSVACSNSSDASGNSFIKVGNDTYRFDRRLRQVENDLANPSLVGRSTSGQCPLVVPSYQNEEFCVRRASCGQPLQFTRALFTLNDTILRSWYTDSTRYVYYFQNLRLEAPFDVSPCVSGVSRWRIVSGTCPAPTSLAPQTSSTISAALNGAGDTNPNVRDITLSGVNCDSTSAVPGTQIQIGGTCYQHVHPNLYDVRDATLWVLNHDGNQEAMAGNRPNPIAKWAEQGLVALSFPASHPMDRWFLRRSNLPFLGRLGDQVEFADLPRESQTEQLAARVGAIAPSANSTGGAIACGSPGEVANRPDFGNHYFHYQSNDFVGMLAQLDFEVEGQKEYTNVITNVIVKAPDQLRQRVAWTLSNIIIVNPVALDRMAFPDAYLGFYDIFVRNAFGNYRDILRDVSYHALMGAYLTYQGNQAYASSNNFPDENYAREIMQLFSVGLWKLNDDGTQKLDGQGNPIPTYTNNDIVDFARIWTGFERQVWRQGLSDNRYIQNYNYVDPMNIRAQWRDRLPKAKLDSGYIGDEYPLCKELAPLYFLRKGAVFLFSGDSPLEGSDITERGRLTPVPGASGLHAALCQPGTDGKCTYPVRVTLPTNLACNSVECQARGRIRVVRIVDPVDATYKYYTFVEPPCVRLAFFDVGNVVRFAPFRSQCADPSSPVHSPSCCTAGNPLDPVTTVSACLYAAEATTLETAIQRCAAFNLTLCNRGLRKAPSFNTTCAPEVFSWTSSQCRTQIQVYASGQIGSYDLDATNTAASYSPVRNNSNNVFRVRWDRGDFPTASGGNCPSSCRLLPHFSGDTCVCDFNVTDTAVFSSIIDMSPISGANAVSSIAASCFIGSAAPDSFDAGTYRECTDAQCSALTGVRVWLHSSDVGVALSKKTVFELPPFRIGGRKRYLLNRVSTVLIAGKSFRNPPHFNPFIGELTDSRSAYNSPQLWKDQSEYEVEALLEHLTEHDSTGPFLAYRFIQQMVTSNPSPRYVTSVVTAFRTGKVGANTFSGKYGDMGALVFAVLTDREARSPVIEADPSFGMLRDPLLKFYQILRGLEYTSPKGREISLSGLAEDIGVEPFSSPSVFSFYLPEYQPPGAASSYGLVSPASQIATAPNVVGWLNGVTSLIDNGLTSCDYGFATAAGNGNHYARNCAGADKFDGNLTYTPDSGATASQIVSDLDLILTTGRMNTGVRDYIISQYNAALAASGPAVALKTAIKLAITSPDFQSNTYNSLSAIPRPPNTNPPSGGRKFKAIVVVFLTGGADSFNMLVPHSNCASKDLYAEYAAVRTAAALNQSVLLPISVPAGTQPCNTFGLHPRMTRTQSLYQSGEAAFMANIGALVEPVTKAEYNSGQKRLPPSLFAHNIMQRSLQSMHAQITSADGLFGRMTQSLSKASPPFLNSVYSINGRAKMVQGKVPPNIVHPTKGVIRLRDLSRMRPSIGNLTAQTSSAIMSELYADAVFQSVDKSEFLGSLLDNSVITPNRFGSSAINQQLAQVSRLIQSLANRTQTERALFFTETGGFDTHATVDVADLFGDVDDGIGNFAGEMKAQGRWDDVVVLTVSDFGRSLTTNGAGTDHAWGGNHFIAGGKIKGGRVLGTFPDTLTAGNNLDVGRGRLIPTTPFEAVWYGLTEWFGVPASEIPFLLPNAANFPASDIFDQSELFKP
jgi:uncharacterized protein (DUF1501 family)/uncharacterized protein (DUF1800 family)